MPEDPELAGAQAEMMADILEEEHW